MKGTVLNPVAHVPDAGKVADLQAYMVGKTDATFDDIETDIPSFNGLQQGQIHQVAIDAGYDVTMR